MPVETTSGEQAVSRAIRDNLVGLQRLGEDLQQALADLVASCASSRPANTLPPLIRAQATAASLQAALDVLARFISSAMPSSGRGFSSDDVFRAAGLASMPAAPPVLTPPVPDAAPQPFSSTPAPEVAPAPQEIAEPAPVGPPTYEEPYDLPTPAELSTPTVEAQGPAPPPMDWAGTPTEIPVEVSADEPVPSNGSALAAEPAPFNVAGLSAPEQDLHRRANRVAKVSMQDINMLKPQEVLLGRQHNDLCVRLRDDIERARKEYDRRFRAILDHPVDYFYHWMVEILAGGNPAALGDYPYPSPVLRR